MTYNILVLNWQDITNPHAGGAEVHLHEIFKRIASQSYHVMLGCCSYQGAKKYEMIDGIEIFRRGKRNLFNSYVPVLYKDIRSSRKIDIVIDDINKIPFYTPLFVKEPIIAILHHLFGASIFSETSLPGALYVRLSESFLPAVYKNTLFSVVSNSTRNELISKRLPPENVRLIHNGVDSARYRKDDSLKSRRPIIGYLGRIKKYKNIDHLLQAMVIIRKSVPDVVLKVIGSGDYLDSLRRHSVDMGVDDIVHFIGNVDERTKVDLLNEVWFTVNPSSKEGWGLTIIESNACGTPVIAADSPGLRDSVVHEKTGFLYPHGDIAKLAEQAIRLINDASLRNNFSHNALEWSRKFNWDDSAAQMLDLIEHILG
ncbi:glycosyltransferase family 4 protein [candidate division KSB1 bacterium]|nr:glycosyltransferase family 4 protein [candidate division KSB1 bacterium]